MSRSHPGPGQEAINHLTPEIVGKLPTFISSNIYPEPDNIFYSTTVDETFSGTAGEVDYFVYNLEENSGSDTILNFEENIDKFILENSYGDFGGVIFATDNGYTVDVNDRNSTSIHVDVVTGSFTGIVGLEFLRGDLLLI
jgi:hypothetical protein